MSAKNVGFPLRYARRLAFPSTEPASSLDSGANRAVLFLKGTGEASSPFARYIASRSQRPYERSAGGHALTIPLNSGVASVTSVVSGLEILVNLSRHAAPMLVDATNKAQVLVRVRLGETPDDDAKRREAFVQDLIHDHPALIPMAEIEPAYSPLISVCKELPTTAGYLDNLWITPWGGLVLGEAKLVRNPQARREVVAQALDYARAVTKWNFEDLQDAVRVARKQPAFTLWSLVEAETDLDESQFVDAVQRRLTSGRLMLLIIGDGIQEGVEALTAHLQLHAGLHVGLALLDLSLWRHIDGSLIVVPRVPMRTVLIERGIVRVEAAGVHIVPPPIASKITAAGGRSKSEAITSSEVEFLDVLATRRAECVEPLRSLLSELSELQVSADFGKTARLFLPQGPNAGSIESSGKVWFSGAWSSANRLGHPDAAIRYLETIAAITGGQLKRYEKSAPEVLDMSGRGTDLASVLARKDEWKQAMAIFAAELVAEENA